GACLSGLCNRLAPLLQEGKSISGPAAMNSALDKVQKLDYLRSHALSDDDVKLVEQNLDLTAAPGQKVRRIRRFAKLNAVVLMQRKLINLEAAAEECAQELQRS